jgi:hypothetical protein
MALISELHVNRFSVVRVKMKYAKRLVQGRMREMRMKLKIFCRFWIFNGVEIEGKINGVEGVR